MFDIYDAAAAAAAAADDDDDDDDDVFNQIEPIASNMLCPSNTKNIF